MDVPTYPLNNLYFLSKYIIINLYLLEKMPDRISELLYSNCQVRQEQHSNHCTPSTELVYSNFLLLIEEIHK